MPIVSGAIHERGGPVIDLLVGVSQARREVLQRNGFPVPDRVRVRALIDTGGGMSGVDQSVLQQLDLRPISQRQIHTSSTIPGNPHTCDEFDVGLFLPHEGGEMYLFSMLVISTRFLPAEGAQALIGRDVLAHCYFAYSGPTNGFILAF